MHPPVIVAHRGLHTPHPENSLAAFRAAWDAGIEWCECDVQESKSGEFFVIHDPTLDRTTDGAGNVHDHTSPVLRQRRLRAADGSVTAEPLPSLRDLLHVMPPGCGLMLEIKPFVPRGPLWSKLSILGNRRVTVQSFHRDVVTESAVFVMRVEFLTEHPEDLADVASLPGAGVNVRHDLLDRRVVERVHAAGKRIGAWTVNADDDIRRILSLGVDTIISDNPLRVRDICREIG